MVIVRGCFFANQTEPELFERKIFGEGGEILSKEDYLFVPQKKVGRPSIA